MRKLSTRTNVIIGTVTAILALMLLFYSSVGFYCKVPTWDTESKPPVLTFPGETVAFRRRATPLGFINSADGIAIEQGFSPNKAIRESLDTRFDEIVRGRTYGAFGFSRFLYLMTTDNVDLYTPPELEKNNDR